MTELLWGGAINFALFCASVLSGMLGIGVAFAAIPILSLSGGDLVHELQPVALFLNGITALFSAIAFARAGHVDWARALWLACAATLFAPLGAYFAQSADPGALWNCYLAAVLVVVVLLFVHRRRGRGANRLGTELAATVPISAFSGLLGVGPGFLLVPVLIFLGRTPRAAAAMNAVAVVPSSFAALIPHLESMHVDSARYVLVVLLAAAGALLGGYLASYRVPDRKLRYLFASVLLGLALYKVITLYGYPATVTAEPLVR